MARRSDHSRDELTRMALDAARKIVEEQGLRGLSTRAVAKIIGYSPGTLYQLFRDQDELILRMNAETLDDLIAACGKVDLSASPEVALKELARLYIDAVNSRPSLWSAVFEHSLPPERDHPAWWTDRTRMLLGFAARAIAPLFGPDENVRCQHQAQVLWAGLYGIAALAAAGKLPAGESPDVMVQTLVRNAICGIRLQEKTKQTSRSER